MRSYSVLIFSQPARRSASGYIWVTGSGADPGVSVPHPAFMFSKTAEHTTFRNKPIKNSSEKENVPQRVLCASRTEARQKRWFARNVER